MSDRNQLNMLGGEFNYKANGFRERQTDFRSPAFLSIRKHIKNICLLIQLLVAYASKSTCTRFTINISGVLSYLEKNTQHWHEFCILFILFT